MVLLAMLTAAAVSAPPYTTTPGPSRAIGSFTVAYRGSGHTGTHYRSSPPNPGGHADHNTVTDSGSERWDLRFSHRLVVGPCATGAAPDPCAAVGTLTGASGPTDAVGRIHHVHKDGLYRDDDRAVRCTVRTKWARVQQTTIDVHYDPAAAAIDVVAHNPMPTTLDLLRSSCPEQGDSLDLLLDNYFTPGFSFDRTYNSDRWFTSQTIGIPVATFHDSATIRIPVALTPAGRSPRSCAVAHRTYEHCTTQGAWKGVVVLTASG